MGLFACSHEGTLTMMPIRGKQTRSSHLITKQREIGQMARLQVKRDVTRLQLQRALNSLVQKEQKVGERTRRTWTHQVKARLVR